MALRCGKLTASRAVAERMYQPYIEVIEDFFEKALEIEERGQRPPPKAVVFTGGVSLGGFVSEWLTRIAERLGMRVIEPQRQDKWNAVAIGASLCDAFPPQV
ncbi:hypothetical protein B0I35DRAFT_480547 [Stachybotrys elegans]|uniref:Uncharacterized protein n=1 Tax=Stachybotrys elegans TaxID=80388 RepID=A0A8K0WPK6_9HYPO|nr:hypothetical protein B0I35DRAFT_480547 [Stachybotrys elegans]